MKRVLVAFDGTSWFARRIAAIELRSLGRGKSEKIYYCDKPIGGRFKDPLAALAAATKGLPGAVATVRSPPLEAIKRVCEMAEFGVAVSMHPGDARAIRQVLKFFGLDDKPGRQPKRRRKKS